MYKKIKKKWHVASGNANVGVLRVLFFIFCEGSFMPSADFHFDSSLQTTKRLAVCKMAMAATGWIWSKPSDLSNSAQITLFFPETKRPNAATLSVQGPMTYEVTWPTSKVTGWQVGASFREFLKQPQPAVTRSTDRIKVVGIPASRTIPTAHSQSGFRKTKHSCTCLVAETTLATDLKKLCSMKLSWLEA